MRIGACLVVYGILAVGLGCDGDVTTQPGVGGAGSTGTANTSSGTGTGTSTGEGGTTVSSSSSSGAGGAGGCATDDDCTVGEQWCVGGSCVECDNSGLACDIACIQGWTTYERNGCFPCECAPTNACVTDTNCPGPIEGLEVKCYPGKLCWDWCPPGDPSCCFGNTCGTVGCSDPNPTGCFITGCAAGESCVNLECASSSCSCDGQSWVCDPDCGGGTCVVQEG
jgi:hypothetical protein